MECGSRTIESKGMVILRGVGVGDLCLITRGEVVRSSSGVRGGGVTLSPSVFEDDGGDFLEAGGVC